MGIAELRPFPPLACSVRGCALPLAPGARSLSCASGHGFDLAARGYVNLLQPNDRRSLEAGDSREQIEARERCFERGIGPKLYAAAALLLAQSTPPPLWQLEVGCGSGRGTSDLAAAGTLGTLGLDLSRAAIERASRAQPARGWIVANADRRLPFQDASLAAVATITGPKNLDEFARVLHPDGKLLVALPGAEDLIELRRAVQGEGRPLERVEGFLALARPKFALLRRIQLLEKHRLEPSASRDLLTATYRAGRARRSLQSWLVGEETVTTSYELLLLGRRQPAGA